MRATLELVRRKARQYWPDRVDEVMSMLEASVALIKGRKNSENEQARIRLAVIKLSEGSFDELEGCIDMARRDYRDVLAYAEYPEEMKSGFAGDGRLSSQERNEIRSIRARDRQQYEAWLMSDPNI